MRLLLILLLSCIVFSAKAEIDIKLLRKLLTESPNNEKTAELFFEQTKNFNETNVPLLKGFKAMSEFMLCKHLSNVFSKLNHFNTGKKLLEDAIKKELKNVELIYFRFTIQTNVPPLLAYSAKIKDDKQFLINYLKDNFSNANKDVDLYKRIKVYLLQNQACTQAEKENIKNL
jgi:hypothetical protein